MAEFNLSLGQARAHRARAGVQLPGATAPSQDVRRSVGRLGGGPL